MSEQFIKLAKLSEFASRRMKSFQILGKFVAIVKDHDGSFYATEIACKHNNADLTTGQFRGDVVTCPRHGWVYNIRTGECLNQPSTPLRRHALKIQGGDIYVSVAPIEHDEAEPDEMPEIQFRESRGE
jgi:nitrite reductase/ring-hydroxylating ferredoxin subunit